MGARIFCKLLLDVGETRDFGSIESICFVILETFGVKIIGLNNGIAGGVPIGEEGLKALIDVEHVEENEEDGEEKEDAMDEEDESRFLLEISKGSAFCSGELDTGIGLVVVDDFLRFTLSVGL